LLASFGERLVELGDPIWRIQKDALGKAKWVEMKGEKNGLKGEGAKKRSELLNDRLGKLSLGD